MPRAWASASVASEGGDCDDVAQLTALDALCDAAGGEDGGAAGAEPDDHARFDKIRRVFGGLLFEGLDIQVGLLAGNYMVLAQIIHH